MNQIDFKVWHKNWGDWISICTVSSSGKVYDSLLRALNPKQVAFVPFTGMIDINEKKIYAGDVVEYEIPLQLERHLSIGQIIWCEERNQWRHSRYSAPYYTGERCRLLGNLFEQPNLLEDLKCT